MMETERTSGNGKTPEDSALFSFRDRGQFLAGVRMRGWRREFRVGFREGFAVLVILFLAGLTDVRMVFDLWIFFLAGLMVFLIPLGAGRCARMIGAGGCGPHPLNLAAGFLVPEAVLAVPTALFMVLLSARSNLSTTVLLVLCSASTCALVTACTATLGALEGKTRGRFPGVWLGLLAVLLFWGGGAFLEYTLRWWYHPLFPWTHVLGCYRISYEANHIHYDGSTFPWGRLLVLQLAAQLPLLLLVLDALRGVLGGRSLVRGARARVLFMAVYSNAWLLLYHVMANSRPHPSPWSVTVYFAWTALGLAAATLLFCCPSRDRLERGLCRASGRPGWLDDAAPVGWLTAAVVLLCLAAHTAALAGLDFKWRMEGTQTGVFLLLCVNLVAAAMAWQCVRAARGRLLGFALTGAMVLCWGWTLYLKWPPEWTTLISPFGSLGVAKRYLFVRYGGAVPPPMHGLLAAAILFNMVLVGVFSVLLAAQCQRMRQGLAARGLTDPHEGTHGKGGIGT